MLFEQLRAKKPDDSDRIRNVALCHKYLAGFYVELHDLQQAYAHSQEAARLDSGRVAADPHDAQARLDYTFDLSTLGDQHADRKEYAQALQQFEVALTHRRALWQADPANAYARNRLAYMLARVAEIDVLLGRHSRAAPLLAETVEHSRALPMQDPSEFRSLGLAYLFLGEVAVASKKSPCRWYRLMEESLARVPEGLKSTLQEDTAKLHERALKRLESCPS